MAHSPNIYTSALGLRPALQKSITNVRNTENTPTHAETFVYTQQEGKMIFQPQFALTGKKLIKNHSLVRPVFCIAP